MLQHEKTNCSDKSAASAKKGYASPKLTPLGRVRELTQSGSGNARENNPHPGPDRRA